MRVIVFRSSGVWGLQLVRVGFVGVAACDGCNIWSLWLLGVAGLGSLSIRVTKCWSC